MKRRKRTDVVPMSPDAVSEILNAEQFEYSCSEAAEVAVRTEFLKLARRLGQAEMKRFLILFSLPLEADLRANHPNHPALPFLDEYHEEQRRLGNE